MRNELYVQRFMHAVSIGFQPKEYRNLSRECPTRFDEIDLNWHDLVTRAPHVSSRAACHSRKSARCSDIAIEDNAALQQPAR